MAKNSSGGAADWKRRVEGDVNKLLGGQPRHAREALAQLVELVKPGDRVQLFTANWGKVQQRSKDGFQLEGGKLRPWSELLSHEVQHGKA